MAGGSETKGPCRSYSVSELSSMTGIPKTTLYKAIRRGDIPNFKLPGMERGTRVRESDALALMGGPE